MKRMAWVMIVAATVALSAGLLAAGGGQSSAPEKQFLYRVQATRVEMLTKGPTQEEIAILGQHFNYLKDLTRKGVVILVGRTLNNDETTFGICIFRAESEQAAREIMKGDPAVKNGVMRGMLFPYQVALMEGKPVPE